MIACQSLSKGEILDAWRVGMYVMTQTSRSLVPRTVGQNNVFSVRAEVTSKVIELDMTLWPWHWTVSVVVKERADLRVPSRGLGKILSRIHTGRQQPILFSPARSYALSDSLADVLFT